MSKSVSQAFVVEEISDEPGKIKESLTNNYEAWGKPLSLDDYLGREKQLHKIHVSHGFSHRTFAVIGPGSGVIAACEVLSRPLYKGNRSFSEDHCVASVFVRPEFRKRGVCNLLLEEVTKSFSKEEDQLSLWSDVGDYYARFGFNFPPTFQGEPLWNRTIKCLHLPQREIENSCELLDLAQTNSQIVAEHQRLLIRDTDTLLHDCQGEIQVSVVVPHVGLYEQLQLRATYTAEKLGIEVPSKFAARTSDGHGWASWTFSFGSKKLMILGIFGSANEMALLLSAAARVAYGFGFEVELYESSIVEPLTDIDELLAAIEALDLSSELKERTTSLPMSIGPRAWMSTGGYAWY